MSNPVKPNKNSFFQNLKHYSAQADNTNSNQDPNSVDFMQMANTLGFDNNLPVQPEQIRFFYELLKLSATQPTQKQTSPTQLLGLAYCYLRIGDTTNAALFYELYKAQDPHGLYQPNATDNNAQSFFKVLSSSSNSEAKKTATTMLPENKTPTFVAYGTANSLLDTSADGGPDNFPQFSPRFH